MSLNKLLWPVAAVLSFFGCNYKGEAMSEKMIREGEVELCTESFGDSKDPAILMVAGATVSMLYWDANFCKHLAERGFFVIRYDNRDVGRSTCYEPGTTPYDIVDLADDAISILDGYAIPSAHFLGMSLGGLISQIAAIKYPDRVKSLTLLATGPWGDSDPTIPEMDSRILEFHGRAETVDWSNEDSVVKYMSEGFALMSGKKGFSHGRVESYIREEFNRANNYISMFNHASLQGGEEYWNRMEEIEQPTLIIHGTDDRIWHVKNAEVLLERIRNTRLITLEGTGHELHKDDWGVIIDGIDFHVKRH